MCECPARFLFSKRWRQGRRICTRNPSHLCTLYSGASFSYTPFKEGIDLRDNTYSRGCTQGYRTDSSNHRLCKISFDCRAAVISVKKKQKTLLHDLCFLSLDLPPAILSPVTQCSPTSLVVGGRCLTACVHTVLHLDL